MYKSPNNVQTASQFNTMAFCIQNYDLRNTFQTERKILLFAGFYPLRSTNQNHALHVFKKCLICLLACSFFFSLMVELVTGLDDLSKFTETLVIFVPHATFLCKLANFTCRQKKILEIEDQLADPQFYGFPKEQLEAFKKKVGSCVLMCNAQRIGYVLAVVGVSVVPFLDESRHKTPPMPGWFPGNYTDYYPLAVGYQTINVSILAATNSALDTFCWIMITVATAQFDVLKTNLMNIHYRREESKAENDEILKKCVKLHLAILRYAASIEQIFSNGIFVQFFSSSAIICVILFQITFEPFGSVRFLSLSVAMSCMLFQVSMYCWYGHDLTITSDGIGRDFYMSNWYESDVRVRKTMMIFLEKVKQPVVLTAGYLIPLSLETLTTVLRSSYSYVAVLRSFYSEK